jgi:hypothetical protein
MVFACSCCYQPLGQSMTMTRLPTGAGTEIGQGLGCVFQRVDLLDGDFGVAVVLVAGQPVQDVGGRVGEDREHGQGVAGQLVG